MQTNDQVSRTQELKVYGSLKSNLGEVALLGMVRAPEFGANAFCIELKSRRPMYGEWRTNIQPKSHDIAVEIISFGYTDPANIWNPSKHARLDFSRKDIENIQILIGGYVNPYGTECTVHIRNMGSKFYYILQKC